MTALVAFDDRIEKRDPVDMMLPTDPNESSDKKLTDDPAQPIDRNEPLHPMQRIDPTLPIERIDPADPIDSRESFEAIDQRDVVIPSL